MKLNYETGEGEEGDAPLSPTGNAILCRCAQPGSRGLSDNIQLTQRRVERSTFSGHKTHRERRLALRFIPLG